MGTTRVIDSETVDTWATTDADRLQGREDELRVLGCDDPRVLVWLTDWQVVEQHLLVAPGDAVAWELCPADMEWTTRLFGDRLVLEWQLDGYGDAARRRARQVRGRVLELRSVRCRQRQASEGIVPVAGAARLQPVHDTSSSWARPSRTPTDPAGGVGLQHPGWRSYSSIFAEGQAEYLYGYVVTICTE
ncbi:MULTISPECIES: DUF6578 domain-containing protein [unclassified Curtobacterium]|jgi:hypothetical protein|uniref:DUF6578 domain-containing protein n=1 Tax=unclassified Curtobacterium TaxID=257496 RepID=UPI0035A91955